jgi:nickel/cobalt exporter
MRTGGHGLRKLGLRVFALVGVMAAFVMIPSAPASAHPLGNFTINHYHGLILSTDRIIDHAVVDSAEIPTVQQLNVIDTNGDEAVSTAEKETFAAQTCAKLASDVTISVNGAVRPLKVSAASVAYAAGAAGLETSRLECTLEAPADLSAHSEVDFEDAYLPDRIGWREITARGDGVALTDPEVPATSISDELAAYPNGLLSSPLDQRSAHLVTAPGQSTDAGVAPTVAEPGWTSRLIGDLTGRLDALVGSKDLTLKVGVLAVLLCLLLGASHAALPGHGKTLMAAYMVGSRGTPRDAVWIGTTVTLAHTAGVLVLGALFSASATIAGESLLAVLGVISGLMVAGIGVVPVRTHRATLGSRGRPRPRPRPRARPRARARARPRAYPREWRRGRTPPRKRAPRR